MVPISRWLDPLTAYRFGRHRRDTVAIGHRVIALNTIVQHVLPQVTANQIGGNRCDGRWVHIALDIFA